MDADDAGGLSFEPLTPTAFLDRAELVHGARPALLDGALALTYAELGVRARRLAGGLRALGASDGERVAVLAANSHLMLEAHYGVPLAGAVLVALNMRLSTAELGYILDHSGARVLLCDRDREEAAQAALAASAGAATLVGADTYERMLADAQELASAVRRRARRARDQLHERHDRPPEGGRLPPPRRLPAGAGDGVPCRAAARQRVPLDAADVPLQRLVLHLGRHRRRGAARLPAATGARRGLAARSMRSASRT